MTNFGKLLDDQIPPQPKQLFENIFRLFLLLLLLFLSSSRPRRLRTCALVVERLEELIHWFRAQIVTAAWVRRIRMRSLCTWRKHFWRRWRQVCAAESSWILHWCTCLILTATSVRRICKLRLLGRVVRLLQLYLWQWLNKRLGLNLRLLQLYLLRLWLLDRLLRLWMGKMRIRL